MIGLGVRTNNLRAESGGGGGNVAPSNVTAPVISGSTSLGSVLTTTNGTWSGTPATFSYTYQWKRNGSPIGGATSSTYTTVVADSTANITCDVTADNGVAPTATAGSNTLTMANYTPANTVPPAVTGTAVVGQTLSTTNGTWTNSPSTFSYQWYRGATLISGATSSTYTLVQADAGNTSNIKCVVTASNGLSASADSNTVVRVLDADANTYVTTVSGGLNSAETSSVNQLYIDLKSNNQLVHLDTLQIYAGPTNASALKPFAGSQTVTPVNSPSWVRKDGYTHTGTSYINTGFIQTVSTKFTRLSNCFGFGCSNKNTTTNGTCGFNNGNLSSILLSAGSAFFPNYTSTQGSSLFTRTIANKDYANRRVDASNRFGFQDGTETSGAMSATSAAFNSQPMFVGALNNNGTAVQIFESGAKTTYYYAGSGDVNPTTMRTIINNFINSL